MQAPKPRYFTAAIALAVATLLMATTRAAHAGWREESSAFDLARMQNFSASREHAIAEAEKGGGTGDSDAIVETLSPAGHPVPSTALLGAWRCRQMKLGGMTPYIVYDWFACRIRMVDGAPFFEKLNGTLRTEGFLYPENGAWVYLGAASEKDEPPHRYSGNQAAVGSRATPDDQIGLLTGFADNRLRIEFPAPVQESDFDAIELER